MLVSRLYKSILAIDASNKTKKDGFEIHATGFLYGKLMRAHGSVTEGKVFLVTCHHVLVDSKIPKQTIYLGTNLNQEGVSSGWIEVELSKTLK